MSLATLKEIFQNCNIIKQFGNQNYFQHKRQEATKVFQKNYFLLNCVID